MFPSIRPPAVAGSFYPGDAAALGQMIQELLNQAAPASAAPRPKALIAPHAGYVYSGPIAANAYTCLASGRGEISRVVLLGPAHRVPVRGLALPGAEAFATPLGNVPVDQQAVALLASLRQVTTLPAAHALEHSLEVQLPFLQALLGDFSIVPLVVGAASPAEVAEVLEVLWGGDETLIVVSSDLSHYLSYEAAQQSDRATSDAILAFDNGLSFDQACGSIPINGLLLAARRRGLMPELLALRNSGDTAGDKSRVVGYGSFAFYPVSDAEQDADAGKLLLRHARHEIACRLGRDEIAPPIPEWLREPTASFVTLTMKGQLRGCIGTLEAFRPLHEDVRSNARAAAFQDPRFPPLQAHELETVRVEVSLLSTPEAMNFASEQEALEQLRPGTDGIVLHYRRQRATFLPQVWETLGRPADFIAQLKRKAGLPADFWSKELRLSRYTVSKWREA